MILRALTLAGGLACGLMAAQFPEFSQQYTQRLGGAVDALGEVVDDFDASAARSGLSRDQALVQMQGSDFVTRRRADMERTIARFDRLRADLDALQGQGPFMRAYHAARFTDRDIAARAWDAYQPALPLTFASAIFAGVGFLTGLIAFAVLLPILRLPLRRGNGVAAK